MSKEPVSIFDFQTHIRSYLSENIALADSKAKVSIYSSLALSFLLVARLFYGEISRLGFSDMNIYLFFVIGLLIFISFLCGVMVLYPQTAPAKKGFIYWGASLNFSLEEYRDELRLLSKDEVLNELAVVNYNLSMINKRKFAWVKWSIQAAIAAFALLLLEGFIFLVN